MEKQKSRATGSSSQQVPSPRPAVHIIIIMVIEYIWCDGPVFTMSSRGGSWAFMMNHACCKFYSHTNTTGIIDRMKLKCLNCILKKFGGGSFCALTSTRAGTSCGVLHHLQRGEGSDFLSLSPLVISHQRVASREDPTADPDMTDQSVRVSPDIHLCAFVFLWVEGYLGKEKPAT